MKKILTMVFVFTWMVLSAETWNYEMHKIAIPTGNTENEIFVYKSPDHVEDSSDEGPFQFQIDDVGNIYILDRKWIKKFNAEGSFINSTHDSDLIIHSFVVNADVIWTICGDYQNNVFLRRFNNDCQLIDANQIENRKSSLAINQNGKVGLNLGNNNFLEFSFQDNDLSAVDKTFLNDCLLDFNIREGRQIVLFPEENIELDLNVIWPNKIGHSFIGFDEEGNLYFNIYSQPLGDSSLGIVSESGEVIETNVIFPHYTQFGLDMARGISNIVAQNGAIYQMIPMKGKVEIRKWEKIK